MKLDPSMNVELESMDKVKKRSLLSRKDSCHSQTDHEILINTVGAPPATVENNMFKPLVFFEFLFYFVLKAFAGPFSNYFFKRFVKNGLILAENLKVHEGSGTMLRNWIWVQKIYCIITTFAFMNSTIRHKLIYAKDGYEYDSMSQFWLLIHTEISLSVLYAAYYASLTTTEISRLYTEVHTIREDIFNRVISLIKLGKSKLYEITNVARSFPEIDLDNFYFVYPKESRDMLPLRLQPETLDSAAKQLNHIGIQDGIIVPCDKYATHIAELGGYQNFDVRVKMITYCSRGLVFVNAILPVINNIYQILADGNQMSHIPAFLIYCTQQLCYSYLLYRLAVVYDVLFLGLLLYYKKYQMLSLLGEVIKVRPEYPIEGLIPVPTTVPQNVENWLGVRKVLASINGQAFVVIDTNMSFVLLYTIMFITFFCLGNFNLFPEVFQLFKKFLSENPAIQAVLTLTVIVITIVLIMDIALGILINRLFMYEREEWMAQESVITNIKVSHELYCRSSLSDTGDSTNCVYKAKMREIRSLLGSNTEHQLYQYTKRLKEVMLVVIKAIKREDFFHPHTVLGIKTDVRLVVMLGTAISAIGVSTFMKIAESVVNTVNTIEILE